MIRFLFVTILSLSAFVGVKAVHTDNDSISEKRLLAIAYRSRLGIECEVNLKKAAAIYGRLAAKGNARAMTELGKMYLTGDGIEKDTKRAARLFGAAAKQGNTNAMCELARMYQTGAAGTANLHKAFALYLKAARLGSAQGLYGAGYMMYKGHGVRQNYKAAVKFLEKGAAMGHSGCELLLGSYYANDFDGEGDMEKAQQHYNRASRHGNSWTVDVTKYNVLDSIMARKSRKGKWKHVRKGVIPQRGMRRHTGNATPSVICGKWSGTAYTYDWSRQVVTGEQDMSLEVENIGDSVRMSYFVGDSLCSSWTAVYLDDKYDSKKVNAEHNPYSWTVIASRFEKKDDVLFAELKTLNLNSRELRRPVMAVLKRDGDNGAMSADDTFKFVRVSAKGSVLSFVIDAETDMDVELSIGSARGYDYRNLGSRKLTSGRNIFTIDALSLQSGVYAVSVSHKDERHSKTVTVRRQ